MIKTFVGGLLMGGFLTIAGALLAGPNITLADVGSGNGGNGDRNTGRYQLSVDEKNGQTTYSIFDTESGKATVLYPDGKTITVKAEAVP